jgi:hypothetical protein
MLAGDSFDSSFLISSTSGVLKVHVGAHKEGELQTERITDASVLVVQLDVDEASGMLFFRTASATISPYSQLQTSSRRSSSVFVALLYTDMRMLVVWAAQYLLYGAFLCEESKFGISEVKALSPSLPEFDATRAARSLFRGVSLDARVLNKRRRESWRIRTKGASQGCSTQCRSRWSGTSWPRSARNSSSSLWWPTPKAATCTR